MRKILVTGASRGLGKALAVEYAAEGVHLVLWARNEALLQECAAQCAAKGASIETIVQDIRDLPRARELTREIKPDLAFLAAGIITGVSPEGSKETAEQASATVLTNAVATINMAAALAEAGQGHIVMISSAAGLYALPNSPAYSASKIAVSFFARALAAEYQGTDVRVSAVYPGYLDTAMGDQLIADMKPLVLRPETAAKQIRQALSNGDDWIYIPRLTGFAMRLLGWMPKKIADDLAKRWGYTVRPRE